ncbi:MAG: hypothetical protein A2901_04850 [Elusimicrobia bacterium RIFCSPLOWO2_01_FULL_54_10]|nr:MAG: hypothetical protein A2901_04850 [Elusimicrobia bacterium RIFCSPLOWO2_01_FULL_54_10]
MKILILCLALAGWTVVPALAAQEVLQEITVKEGDTLWAIAQTYMKDPRRWPEILKHNKLSTDPSAALPGMKIKIPVLLIREELRKAYLVYLLNEVRYRKKNESQWRKGVKDAELLNDDVLRTMDESRAHVRFYSGDLLKMDQNSLVVLRPELKVEEVDLLAGTLQAGRVKLRTQTAHVTPLTKDTLYKARLRIDKGLIVQVERGSTEVVGANFEKRVIVPADHATITLADQDPIDPVKVGKLPGLGIVDFDSKNRVIVPSGHANITFPDQNPSVPMKVPALPDFEMIDFDSSGKPIINSLYGKKNEKSGKDSTPSIPPVEGYRTGTGSSGSGMSGSSAAGKVVKEVKVRKFYRIQFSLDPQFRVVALDKKNPMGAQDPQGEKSEYGLPDGIYFRRFSYQDAEGNETAFTNLPELDIDNLPPKLTIQNPPKKYSTRKQFVQVDGQTEPRCFVRVNDVQVPIKAGAKFSWSVLLKDGENKIQITVTDKKKNVTRQDISVTKLVSTGTGQDEEEQ